MDEVLESLKLFPKQCEQAWEDTRNIILPKASTPKAIVICSMGASSFGYYIVKSLFEDQLTIPICLVGDYDLPNFVDEKTLVIVSSYSGSTEEPISCLEQAVKRKSLITGITKPDSLMGKMLTDLRLPYYELQAKYNPAEQPRMATGYTVLGLMGILEKLNILPGISAMTESAINFVKQESEKMTEMLSIVGKFIANTQPLFISAQHLGGNGHILCNQLNESAKNFADFHVIPELNHHLLEGLKNPDVVRKNTSALFFNSKFYSERIEKRLKLTEEVIVKNGLRSFMLNVLGETRIQEAFWLIAFGGFVSYYLSRSNKENAIDIPWVDYFKKELSAQNEE